MNETISCCINFLHEILYLFSTHLRSHVCHELFELGYWDFIIFIAVEVFQLGNHIFWSILILQFVLHHSFQILELDHSTTILVNLLSNYFKLFWWEVEIKSAHNRTQMLDLHRVSLVHIEDTPHIL